MKEHLFPIDDFTEDLESPSSESQACHQGDICETRFMYDAKVRGYEIFTPQGHGTKVDIAIRKPGYHLVSVQIKKATYNKARGTHSDYWKWMCGSGKPSCANNPNDYGLRYTKYKKGDFHVIGGYIMELESWAFYDIEEVMHKSCITWRPNNSQVENNWEIFDKYFNQ